MSNDLKETVEQHATKLFGGAQVIVEPYQDSLNICWDVTIIPKIDGEVRFIRVNQANGLPAIMNYLKKIQSYLLKVQQNTVVGINVEPKEIDQGIVDKAIEDKLSQSKDKPGFTCIQCNFKTKYPGIFAIHSKKHKKVESSISRAANDPLIYDVKE